MASSEWGASSGLLTGARGIHRNPWGGAGVLAMLLLLPRELPLLSLDWERKPVTHQERFLCSSSPAGWIPAEGHFVKHVNQAKNKQKNRKKPDSRHTYPLGNMEVILGPPHCACIKAHLALPASLRVDIIILILQTGKLVFRESNGFVQGYQMGCRAGSQPGSA